LAALKKGDILLDPFSHARPKYIVDVHTHIYEEHYREKLIEETLLMPGSDELKLIRGSDGKFSSLQKSADENNISRFFILPVARGPKAIERINEFYYRESKTDKRAVLCGTVSPGHPRLKEILDLLKSRDAKMIKLHSMLQGIDILGDPALEMLEEIEKAGFPVIFDTARVPQKYFGPEDHLKFRTEPEKLIKLHNLLPGLKIIAAHGGGVLITDRERKSLVCSGIYIEISTSFNTCDWPENHYERSIDNLSYVLNNHDQDKLFFGTDSPWRNQGVEIEELIRLHLLDKITRNQMEDIFWRNANRFFDLGLE
jgi:predicted TIM-barrel fold metal-dependent hydrolase